jgi:hypothetical protein
MLAIVQAAIKKPRSKVVKREGGDVEGRSTSRTGENRQNAP